MDLFTAFLSICVFLSTFFYWAHHDLWDRPENYPARLIPEAIFQITFVSLGFSFLLLIIDGHAILALTLASACFIGLMFWYGNHPYPKFKRQLDALHPSLKCAPSRERFLRDFDDPLLKRVAGELYDLEKWPPANIEHLPQMQYRLFPEPITFDLAVLKKQYDPKRFDAFSKAVHEAFDIYEAALPKGTSPFTVPLKDALPDYVKFKEALCRPLTYNDNPDLFRQFRNNVRRIALKQGGSELDLQFTPLKPLLDIQVPFVIPEKSFFSGTWIVAPRERGKTTLLNNLIKDHLRLVSEGKASVIVFDSKGELLGPLRKFRLTKELHSKGRLVLLEADEKHPLALNPLDIGATTSHTIALLDHLFSLLKTEQTQLQSTLFRKILIALLAIPSSNFATFRQFLEEGWQPFEKYIRTLEPPDRDFFLKPIADGSKFPKSQFESTEYAKTRGQLLWRITNLTDHIHLMRPMFAATKTKINMAKEMDAGKLILIDNAMDKWQAEGVEFFSRFFLTLIRAAAQQRASIPDERKMPVYVYLDEAHDIIRRDEQVATILDQCRSQKIALICAHQGIAGQIDLPSVERALSDCAIIFANTKKETAKFAPLLFTEPENLNQDVGIFNVYVHGKTDKAVILKIPLYDLTKQPQMTDADLQAIRHDMHKRYCIEPEPEPEPELEPEPEEDEERELTDEELDGLFNMVPDDWPDGAVNPTWVEAVERNERLKAKRAASEATSSKPKPASNTDPHSGKHTKPSDKWGAD